MVSTINCVKPSLLNGSNTKQSIHAKANPLEPVSDGKNGMRTPTGRFAAGNKCGKGNPHARKLSAMRKAFADVVDEDKLKQLAGYIFQRSMAGDMGAAKLLLSYVVGKPVEAVNPDLLDLEEWELVRQSPTQAELMAIAGSSVQPSIAANIITKSQPLTPDAQLETVLEGSKQVANSDLTDCMVGVMNHRHHRKGN